MLEQPNGLPGSAAAKNLAASPHDWTTADAAEPTVEIFPAHTVRRRRTATWHGMAAEIVQATAHDRIETRFCAPVHLLAVCERGVREDGHTFVEGLPRSTLHDFRHKLTSVRPGHEYYDWQEPRILGRVAYFYFDPARLCVDPELGFSRMSFAPRLFFENAALWDTARKLTTLIEGGGVGNRLYFEALCVVLAHELVRLNAGTPSIEPQVRGGLAAWQQRTVRAYIEDHLDELIALATLAQLA